MGDALKPRTASTDQLIGFHIVDNCFTASAME